MRVRRGRALLYDPERAGRRAATAPQRRVAVRGEQARGRSPRGLQDLRNSLEGTERAVPRPWPTASSRKPRSCVSSWRKPRRTPSRSASRSSGSSGLKSLDEGYSTLAAGTPSPAAGHAHQGIGSGDRQYLTGLKVGGERILVLVDVSASMMDESVVNVIRLRGAAHGGGQVAPYRGDRRLAHVAASCEVEVPGLRLQHAGATAVSAGKWLAADDAAALNDVLRELRKRAAQGRNQPRERTRRWTTSS